MGWPTGSNKSGRVLPYDPENNLYKHHCQLVSRPRQGDVVNTRVAIMSILGATAALPVAQAQDVGKWIWRVGVHDVEPKSDNNDIVNVDSASMLTFNGTYLFAPHWGVELLASLPFQHDVNLNGGGKVGEAGICRRHSACNTISTPTVRYGRTSARAQLHGVLRQTHDWRARRRGPEIGRLVRSGATVRNGHRAELSVVRQRRLRWFDIDSDATVNGVHIGTVEIDPYSIGVSVGRRF
jgi:outer membrane protein